MRGGAPDVKSISSSGVLMARGAHTEKRVEGRFHCRISKATKQNLSSHISGRRRDVDSMCTFCCLGCFRDVAGYLIGLHRGCWMVSFLGHSRPYARLEGIELQFAGRGSIAGKVQFHVQR